MNVGEEKLYSQNRVYVGFGNTSDTGILNISGSGSALIIKSNAPYLGDSAENGTLYLGYIGKGIVNITDGGELYAGRLSASTTFAGDDPTERPPRLKSRFQGTVAASLSEVRCPWPQMRSITSRLSMTQ